MSASVQELTADGYIKGLLSPYLTTRGRAVRYLDRKNCILVFNIFSWKQKRWSDQSFYLKFIPMHIVKKWVALDYVIDWCREGFLSKQKIWAIPVSSEFKSSWCLLDLFVNQVIVM